MNLESEDSLDESKLSKGEKLREALDSISSEEKNAIIWFRCNEGKVPDEVNLQDDVEFARIEATLRALGNFGTVYLSEEDFAERINELREEYGELLDDPVAWDVLTRIETAHSQEYVNYGFECDLYLDGEKINEAGVDLFGESDTIELITCKFNASSQHKAACRRIGELLEISDKIGGSCIVGISTLALKLEDAIIGDLRKHEGNLDVNIDNLDRIITGIDMLDFERNQS